MKPWSWLALKVKQRGPPFYHTTHLYSARLCSGPYILHDYPPAKANAPLLAPRPSAGLIMPAYSVRPQTSEVPRDFAQGLICFPTILLHDWIGLDPTRSDRHVRHRSLLNY